MASRSSSGGAAAAGGVGFEAQCLAWFAAHLLAEQRLPEWATGGRVVGVGGQTARPVDDIGVLTEEGGWVQVQAKKGLSLGTKSNSPLGKALAQVVEAARKGVPERSALEAFRPLEPDIDCLLILGDHKSPQTVATALSNVVRRLRRLPRNVPLTEAGKNEKESAAREACCQLVVATLGSESRPSFRILLRTSRGVKNPSVWRGFSLSSFAMASSVP
jgi:hypothetical protein